MSITQCMLLYTSRMFTYFWHRCSSREAEVFFSLSGRKETEAWHRDVLLFLRMVLNENDRQLRCRADFVSKRGI